MVPQDDIKIATIIVPRETLRIDRSMLEGIYDIHTVLSSEITLEDLDLDIKSYKSEVLKRGGRVFQVRDDDMPLIVHSEESMAFRRSIERK